MTTKDEWYTEQDETIADYKFRMTEQNRRADMHLGNWHIEARIDVDYADGSGGSLECLPTFMVYALGIREALYKAMDVLQATRLKGTLPPAISEYGSIEARNPKHKNTTATYYITATY